jgi:hypothetical protein
MTSLNKYIIDIATEKLEAIIHTKYTEEEEIEYYYASEDYGLHLNYLIESWVSHIEKQFNNYEEKYHNKDFNYISALFEYGDYYPYFNNEWLDDIFERHILVTSAVCLK